MCGGKGPLGFRRWHLLIGILRNDPTPYLGLLWVARLKGGEGAWLMFESAVFHIKP